jgi:hypothetical protein
MNTESTKERSSTDYVSLPSQLEHEETWKAVKGPDERPLRGRPCQLPTSPLEGYADGKQLIIRKAATSALTFMTFS